MLEKNYNFAQSALREGKKLSAAWLQAASPITAEILAEAGFDVLLIDLEHAPGDIQCLISQIHAMKGERAVPFVRPASNDATAIKRVLDAGAYGIVVPYVSTKSEAEYAIAAARYPPVGFRGIAGSPRAAHYGHESAAYFATANREICVFLQVETPEGVKNIEEILSVQGLNGIFIGPMDLATTHGFLGTPQAPEVQSVIETLEDKILKAGVPMATICSSFEDAKSKYSRGYQLITLIHDTVTLGRIARAEVAKFTEQILITHPANRAG